MASRAWVAAETGVRLNIQLADAGMTAADETGNMKEPIDDALRMMGYGEDDLTAPDPQPSSIEFLTLVEYTTLRRVLRRIGDRFDIGTGGDQLRLQQVVATVERMIKAAQADVIRVFGAIPNGATDDTGDGILYIETGMLTSGATGVVSRDWPYTVVGVGDG